MNRNRLVIAAAMVSHIACGASPLTSSRIEHAIASTFTSLVQVQIARLGLPPPASDITVQASCHRLIPESGARGSGDWVCQLAWFGPNRTTLQDTYDLTVGTDACYTATVDGTNTGLGGPTVPAADGSLTRNLLYAFDGCFDPTR
jgi:hypothetical protein